MPNSPKMSSNVNPFMFLVYKLTVLIIYTSFIILELQHVNYKVKDIHSLLFWDLWGLCVPLTNLLDVGLN